MRDVDILFQDQGVQGSTQQIQGIQSTSEEFVRKKNKILRSDNGGEDTSTEFNDFCKQAGIKRELTIPYNTQQNGVAERKNRATVEATKAMIHDQSLPMFLWAEASKTVVYVQNKFPHKEVKNMTP